MPHSTNLEWQISAIIMRNSVMLFGEIILSMDCQLIYNAS